MVVATRRIDSPNVAQGDNLRAHWASENRRLLQICQKEALQPIKNAAGLSGLFLRLGDESEPVEAEFLPLIGIRANAMVLGIGTVTKADFLASQTANHEQNVVHVLPSTFQKIGQDFGNLCALVLFELTQAAGFYLQKSSHHPSLRDFYAQKLLSHQCQAEMIQVAARDTQCPTTQTFVALNELVHAFAQWCVYIPSSPTDFKSLLADVQDQVGSSLTNSPAIQRPET